MRNRAVERGTTRTLTDERYQPGRERPACRYVRIGSNGKQARYLSLDQNPFALAINLYRRGKPFGYRGRGFAGVFKGIARNARLILSLLRLRMRLPDDAEVVSLPVPGQLCLKVHNGYKVFDLQKKVVIKIFSPDTDLRKVETEIEKMRSIGAEGFAPTIRRSDVNSRWYEEDFIDGYPASQLSLAPLLAEMMVVDPPREVVVRDYAQQRQEVITKADGKLSDEHLDPHKVDRIRRFVAATIQRLLQGSVRQVFLVMSHGDFSPRHVFTGADGLIAVDWELLGYRSALFDLHDAVFQRFVSGHAADDMSEILEVTRARLQSMLQVHSDAEIRKLAASLADADTYRLLYYVDCICSFVEQASSITGRGVDKLLAMTEAYDRYERQLDVTATSVVNHFVATTKLGKRRQYVSVDEAPIGLANLLYRYGKPLHFRAETLRRVPGCMKRILYLTSAFLYRRLVTPDPGDTLVLPVRGQLAMKVRNGFKVFDLRRKVVTKVFAADVDPEKIRHEIDWAIKLGRQGIAPAVTGWNVQERWYEEQYFNGYPASAADHEKVIALLARPILAFPPQQIGALEHAVNRQELIRHSRFSGGGYDEHKLHRMWEFVDAVVGRLRTAGERQIFLVCSHGDYLPSHVLRTDHGDVIIDWEAAGIRSALFDLYNTFFRRLRGQAASPHMSRDMEQAVHQLQQILQTDGSELHREVTRSLIAADTYRLVYYVEYVYLFVEKEKWLPRHLDRILFFIRAFNEFEEKLAAVCGKQSFA